MLFPKVYATHQSASSDPTELCFSYDISIFLYAHGLILTYRLQYIRYIQLLNLHPPYRRHVKRVPIV